MDIYVDDALLADDRTVTNTLQADGFRIYSVNGALAEIDNIALYASAVAVPEPGTYALLAGMFALASVMLRRRSVK